MTKTVLNVKTDIEVKKAAQKLAKEMGVPLSTIVNAQLKQLISERQISLRAPLIPNARTRRIIDKARADFRKGKNISPIFSSGTEMDAWLERHA